MKRKWDKLVTIASHDSKGIKRKNRVYLIPATLFLLFLISLVYLSDSESRLPVFVSLTMLSEISFYSPAPAQSLHEPVVKGTTIVGKDAVSKFRRHLDCFSESGKWVYDPTPRVIPWNYVGDPYTDACESRHQGSGSDHISEDVAKEIAAGRSTKNWSVREELKWAWKTNSSCPWRSIIRNQFCREIGPKGHVMVVGDSINHEISWSLMNALIMNGSGYQRLDGASRAETGPEMCSDILGIGSGFNVSFICNVYLTTVSNLEDPESIQYPWIDLLGEYNTKILILNRGAHYQEDEPYFDTLRNVFTILTQSYPHIHVIFRNTPPGHLGCQTHTKPLNASQHDWQGLPGGYQWDDFNRQNLLAKKMVEEFEYTYMDVYSMLSLRPEAHINDRDCLHYCVPGPLDVAVEYLYNILLLL